MILDSKTEGHTKARLHEKKTSGTHGVLVPFVTLTVEPIRMPPKDRQLSYYADIKL